MPYKNLEIRRAYARRYYKTNCARWRDEKRIWAQTHPEENRIHQAKWKASHKDQILNTYLKHKYGITKAEYDVMSAAQGHKCAICEEAPTRGRLHVDHDHKTGAVRKLLCERCNWALAQFERVGIGRFRDYLFGEIKPAEVGAS